MERTRQRNRGLSFLVQSIVGRKIYGGEVMEKPRLFTKFHFSTVSGQDSFAPSWGGRTEGRYLPWSSVYSKTAQRAFLGAAF